MKYYKHISRSGDDPDIHDGVELCGPEAYYVFFRTLEIMAEEFDIKNPGKNQFSVSFLVKKFQISARKVAKNLKFFNKRGRILCRFYKDEHLDMVELNCPKLKELSDEYTQKLLR